MPLSDFFSPALLLLSLVVSGTARLPYRRRSTAVPRDAEAPPAVPPDRWPDNRALGGVPLRILLSERSSPGALLREIVNSR